MSRKANAADKQASEQKTPEPEAAPSEVPGAPQSLEADARVAEVMQGLANIEAAPIPKVKPPEALVGGAPGAPPEVAKRTASLSSALVGQFNISLTPEQIAEREANAPKPKFYVVENSRFIRGVPGIDVMIGGLPVFLSKGRRVSDQQYDIAKLRQQGVELSEEV